MKRLVILLVSLLVVGCVTVPPNTFLVTPEALKKRQIETRRYDTVSEMDLVVASSNVLQDLGFNLDNSETKLGVLTASKQRDATDGGEVAAAVIVALLGGGAMAISKDQTIRVSLVVRPAIDDKGVDVPNSNFVRVTFQRVVRRTDNSMYAQTLGDESLYVDFFDRLSKSVFIEAQKI